MPKDAPTDKELVVALEYQMLQQEKRKLKQQLDAKFANTVAAIENDKPSKQTFTPMYAPSLEHVLDTRISTLSSLYASSISFQQYLVLRQKQIEEFSAMATWYKKKKQTIEEKLLAQGLTGEQLNEVLNKNLHAAFISEYQEKFYSQQKFNISADYKIKDEYQMSQIYALMELFENTTMKVMGDSFTIDITQDGKTVNLVTGKTIGKVMEMSCSSEVLNDPKLCDRALLLMVDQRRRLLGRTFEQQDDTFPILGNARPELLLRLYHVALIQNLNPCMEQNCMDSIIAHGTNYVHVLAHFILIKQQAGKPLSAGETEFMQQQIAMDKAGKLKEYAAERLQTYNLGNMEKSLTARYGKHMITPVVVVAVIEESLETSVAVKGSFKEVKF